MAEKEGFSIYQIRTMVDEAQSEVNVSLPFRGSLQTDDKHTFSLLCNQLDLAVKAGKDKGRISHTKRIGPYPRRYSVAETLCILGEITQASLQDTIRGRVLGNISITKEVVTRAEEMVLYTAVGKNPPTRRNIT